MVGMGRTHCKVPFLDGLGKPTKKRLRKKKIRNIIITFTILLALFLVAVLYSNPSLIGLVVQEKTQQHVEQLNLEFTNSTIYEWNIENTGELVSLKISGELEGEGEARIYLEDYLIYDSAKQEKTSFLTGLTIEESPERETEPVPTSTEETLYSEEQAPEQEESPSQSPSQQEPVPSSETTEPSEETEEIVEEIPEKISEPVEESVTPKVIEPVEPAEETVENRTEPEEEIPEETVENITEEVIENITEVPEETVENRTEVPTVKEEKRKFNDVCEETCELSLEQDTYSLRIEINNATFYLDKIKYEITTKELTFNQTNQTETNVTLTNQTITEVNVTNITDYTPQIKLGEPVKWIKQVKLEQPGSLKVKLPKEAKNISVNKIRDLYSKEQEVKPSEQSEELAQNLSPSQNSQTPLAPENHNNKKTTQNTSDESSYSENQEEAPETLSPSQNQSPSQEDPLPSENKTQKEKTPANFKS